MTFEPIKMPLQDRRVIAFHRAQRETFLGLPEHVLRAERPMDSLACSKMLADSALVMLRRRLG